MQNKRSPKPFNRPTRRHVSTPWSDCRRTTRMGVGQTSRDSDVHEVVSIRGSGPGPCWLVAQTHRTGWTDFPWAGLPKERTIFNYLDWTDNLKAGWQDVWEPCQPESLAWCKLLMGIPQNVNNTFFSGALYALGTYFLCGSQTLACFPPQKYSDLCHKGRIRPSRV